MVPKLKNLDITNTIKKFQANTSNKVPESYNMTPKSDSINDAKVRNKFDKTYMKGSGEIKTWNKGKPNMLGGSISIPGRNKAFAKAGAIAVAVASTIPVEKMLSKWDQFVETTPFLKNLLK